MEIFWRLLFGHLLADFTLQTNAINRWKRTSLWGMAAHCAVHPLCYAALTFSYLWDDWVGSGPLALKGWACILILFAAHFLEDQWRITAISRYKAPDNTLHFFWDQVIHTGIIFAVSPVLTSGGDLMPEKWPVMGCLAVALTHGSTVAAYFVEKDLSGGDYPGFDEKYLGMGERLVLALCFLLPQHGWLIFGLLWLACIAFLRARRILDLSWFSFGFGAVVSVVCGIMARAVYYS